MFYIDYFNFKTRLLYPSNVSSEITCLVEIMETVVSALSLADLCIR